MIMDLKLNMNSCLSLHLGFLLKKQILQVAKKASTILIQFSTSCLCEFGFSSLNKIKCKKRERFQCTGEEMSLFVS